MAIQIGSHPARLPVVQQQRQGPGAKDDREEERGGVRLTDTPRRPGVLSTALDMQDDLSALVASLQRRREAGRQESSRGSVAWIDHVLDENVHQKVLDVRKALEGMRSPAQLLAMLKERFLDPSDMLAVLQAFIQDEALEEARALLRQALDDLIAEQQAAGHGTRLRAGVNVAVKAKLAARTGGLTASRLRESYRDFICSHDDCAGQYASWIADHGFDRRALVVDFMEQAVGADMYALDPSCSHLEFGRLLRLVRNTSALRSTDHVLVQHCARTHVLRTLQMTAEDMVWVLLSIVRGIETWSGVFAGPLHHARLLLGAEAMGGFLQGLRRSLRALPADVWDSPEQQHAAQEELEALVVTSVHRGAGAAAWSGRLA